MIIFDCLVKRGRFKKSKISRKVKCCHKGFRFINSSLGSSHYGMSVGGRWGRWRTNSGKSVGTANGIGRTEVVG